MIIYWTFIDSVGRILLSQLSLISCTFVIEGNFNVLNVLIVLMLQGDAAFSRGNPAIIPAIIMSNDLLCNITNR